MIAVRSDRAPTTTPQRSLSMLSSSLALIGSKVATMGLGFFFWLVAARLFPASSVGLAAGAVSAVMLCTQLGLLGLGSSVIVHYPRHRRRPSVLLDTAFTIVCASSLIAAGVFFVVAALFLHQLRVVTTQPLFAASFAAMSLLGTAGILFDQVSTAIRRGDQALSRALGFGGMTLVLLGAASGVTHTTRPALIFSTWVGGGLFACTLGTLQFRRAFAGYRYRPRIDRDVGAGLLRVGIPNHLLTLTERAPGLVLPIIVTELLSPTANAAWYAAWMMAWVVYIIPIQVGMTSFAEASHRPHELRDLVWYAVRTSVLVGVGTAAVVAVAAHPLLSLLGHHYAATGTPPLRILVVAVLPLTIIQAYFVACRSIGCLREAIVTGVVNASLGIGGAAAVARPFGLSGMAATWLAAQVATACWAGWRVRRLVTERGRSVSTAAVLTQSAPEQLSNGRARHLPVEPLAQPELANPLVPVAASVRDHGVAETLAAVRPTDSRGAFVSTTAIGLTTAGVVLWASSLAHIDLGRMTDAGLISVLPLSFFVALAFVSIGFLSTLHARPDGRLLFVHLMALIAILFGTTCVIEHVPHISATWRHVGIIDYISRTHDVSPDIDAYFNWPGFFIVSAFVAKIAGVGSTIGFARWAPLLYDLVFVLPVFLIARAVTSDRRLVWTTVWLFSISDWVAQDYFSPQATTYLLYLVALALLLWGFSVEAPVIRARFRSRFAPAPQVEPTRVTALRESPAQRVVLLLVVTALIAATVPSHQLTPFALLAGTAGLVAVRGCTARGLPLLVLVMITAWVSYLSFAFLAGHFGHVAGSVGKVDQNVASNLGGRLHGNPDHLIVVMTRVGVTLSLWLLALVGLARRLRHGYRVLPVAALAAAPFPLIGLQSYGGEILLRIYLFALPFMAFFAAAAFFTGARARGSWRATTAVSVVSALLLMGFLISRYGNERIDYFTGDEVSAMRYVNDVAPKDASVIALSRDFPRAFSRYGDLRYVFVSELPQWKRFPLADDTVGRAYNIVRRTAMASRDPGHAYVLVTTTQLEALETLSNEQPHALRLLSQRLRNSHQFRTLFAARDAFVLQLRRGRRA